MTFTSGFSSTHISTPVYPILILSYPVLANLGLLPGQAKVVSFLSYIRSVYRRSWRGGRARGSRMVGEGGKMRGWDQWVLD